MSKRKPVSAEEKRTRMLELLHEKKDFFQLKELEKIAPKEKQVVAQSVKEVILYLVDDGLVDTDKIGTSVYFWSFPSKAKLTKKSELDNTKSKLIEYEKKLNKNQEIIKKEKVGKAITDERRELLDKLEALEDEKKKLDAEVKKLEGANPVEYDQMKNNIVVAIQAGNRWTDNIFALKTYCLKKFFIDDSILNKQFGIPEDMDYLD